MKKEIFFGKTFFSGKFSFVQTVFFDFDVLLSVKMVSVKRPRPQESYVKNYINAYDLSLSTSTWKIIKVLLAAKKCMM